MGNILLVDHWNLFARSYASSPLLSPEGEPVGGTISSLVGLSSFIENFKPSKVLICKDGRKGKERRKKIYEGYKFGRKSVKLNRQYGLTEEEEKDNKYEQVDALNEIINHLPFYVLEVESCEADDLIAYVSLQLFRGENKTIISTDKDFLSLIREDVKLYSPTKKILYDQNKLAEEYNIKNPLNFTIYKSLIGDKSDNVKNIEGIGPKTIEKMFPFLYEDKEHLLEDVFTFSRDAMRDDKNKLNDKYKMVLENKDMLVNNYKITQLQSSMLNPSDTESVKEQLNKPLNFNVAILRLFIERNLMVTSLDVNRFINNLQYLKHQQ